MELSYDWKGFQSLFLPQRRASGLLAIEPSRRVWVVSDQDCVIAAYSESENFHDWLGAPVSEFRAHFSNRKIHLVEQREIDQWLSEARSLPHFYLQRGFLAKKAVGEKQVRELVRSHFLFEALNGWWSRILPSTYGMWIRLQGSKVQDFLVIIKRGVIERFHEPDLSSLGSERIADPQETVRHLSKNYAAPIQGIVVSAEDWSAWTLAHNPWRQIAIAVITQRAKLVPFRWGIGMMLGLKAFFNA